MIRLLGKKYKGKLIFANDDINNKNAKLVEITPTDIKDHLIMVYFENYSTEQVEELVVFFQKAFKLELRKSKDKIGRQYYWRPVLSKNVRLSHTNDVNDTFKRRDINEAFGYPADANIMGMNYDKDLGDCSPDELGQDYFLED